MHKYFSVTQHILLISRVVKNNIITAIFNSNVDTAVGPRKSRAIGEFISKKSLIDVLVTCKCSFFFKKKTVFMLESKLLENL